MILYHWTPNKKLQQFTRKYIFAWATLEKAKLWQELNKNKGKIIIFEVKQARKYKYYYVALLKNITNYL